MTQRRHHIHFRMTRISLECECFCSSLRPRVEHTQTLPFEGRRGRESRVNGITIGISWIMHFSGPSREFRPWTSEYLLRKSSNWDVGYVVFKFLPLSPEGSIDLCDHALIVCFFGPPVLPPLSCEWFLAGSLGYRRCEGVAGL